MINYIVVRVGKFILIILCYIAVYYCYCYQNFNVDITNEDSFSKMKEWVEELQQNVSSELIVVWKLDVMLSLLVFPPPVYICVQYRRTPALYPLHIYTTML